MPADKSEDRLPEALSDIEQTMPGFARWMYRTVRRNLGELVLDAGAGLGTYTELMLKDCKRVIALETHPPFVEQLRLRFADDERVSVHEGDLSDSAAFAAIPTVNSVLCLNVLEHIEDDVQAMRNLLELTRPGGTMAALVPAYPWLFNKMDVSVGHVRRYSKGEFVEHLTRAGWKVERVVRFNAFGIPGWFVAGSILKRSTPGRDLTKLFDVLVPVTSFLDQNIVRSAVGLSVIAICRRPQ